MCPCDLIWGQLNFLSLVWAVGYRVCLIAYWKCGFPPIICAMLYFFHNLCIYTLWSSVQFTGYAVQFSSLLSCCLFPLFQFTAFILCIFLPQAIWCCSRSWSLDSFCRIHPGYKMIDADGNSVYLTNIQIHYLVECKNERQSDVLCIWSIWSFLKLHFRTTARLWRVCNGTCFSYDFVRKSFLGVS